jgi:hypothetical protein
MAEPQYGQVRGISEMKGAGTLEEMEHHPQGEAIALPGQRPSPAPSFQFVMPEAVPARRLELPLLLASFLRYPHPPGHGLVVGQLL